MNTIDLVLIGAAGVALYLIFGKTQIPVAPAAPAPAASGPIPSQSPYWGYPPNIMNTSPSANGGWTSDNTSSLITGLAGLGVAITGALK